MKNILLPTDFSVHAQNAIDYALKFFKNELCTFYILHVEKAGNYTTDDLMAAPANATVHQSVLKSARKKLYKTVSKLKEENTDSDFFFKALIDYDHFTDAIAQAVTAHKIDLIIMGSNGATGALEVLLGSNTIQVIRNINCPVLIVPQFFSYKNIHSVLYALDYDDAFNAENTELLTDILYRHKASIKILRVKEIEEISISEFEEKQAMKKYFQDFIHSFYSITNVPTADAINSFVQILNVDLTVMVLEPETFLERFISGSSVSKINYSSLVPLLILHP